MNNSATQAAPATVGESTQATTATASGAKKEKLTARITAVLSACAPGATLNVSEIQTQLGATDDKSRNVVQSTLSQLVKKGRVEKVTTGRRQPGYRVATSK